jgi:chorismate--pyruvate lyase
VRHAWRPLTAAALRCLPARLRPWLADCGSLTAALRRTLGEALECRLQAQGWRRATADEAARLGLGAGSALFWRRVRFSHAGRTLLIGHTFAPPAALAAWPALRRLGDRPVGELLFADPAVRRARIELAVTPLMEPADTGPVVAARRALVPTGRQPLLVMEHFLPAMLHLPVPP